MSQFFGEVITGPKGGHVAMVSNGTTVYEMHAMGDARHREFYCRPAAEELARNSAKRLNDGFAPHSSFIRRA